MKEKIYCNKIYANFPMSLIFIDIETKVLSVISFIDVSEAKITKQMIIGESDKIRSGLWNLMLELFLQANNMDRFIEEVNLLVSSQRTVLLI
jgi:hypothetical protein